MRYLVPDALSHYRAAPPRSASAELAGDAYSEVRAPAYFGRLPRGKGSPGVTWFVLPDDAPLVDHATATRLGRVGAEVRRGVEAMERSGLIVATRFARQRVHCAACDARLAAGKHHPTVASAPRLHVRWRPGGPPRWALWLCRACCRASGSARLIAAADEAPWGSGHTSSTLGFATAPRSGLIAHTRDLSKTTRASHRRALRRVDAREIDAVAG